MNKLWLILTFIFLLGLSVNAQVKKEKLEWKELVSQTGRFRATFPFVPEISVNEQTTSAGKLLRHSYIASPTGSEIAFGVIYADILNPPKSDEASLKARYDYIRDGFVTKAKYELIREREIRVNGKLGRELIMKSEDGITHYQTFIVGIRSYQVLVAIDETLKENTEIKAKINKFLDSFQLIEK